MLKRISLEALVAFFIVSLLSITFVNQSMATCTSDLESKVKKELASPSDNARFAHAELKYLDHDHVFGETDDNEEGFFGRVPLKDEYKDKRKISWLSLLEDPITIELYRPPWV